MESKSDFSYFQARQNQWQASARTKTVPLVAREEGEKEETEDPPTVSALSLEEKRQSDTLQYQEKVLASLPPFCNEKNSLFGTTSAFSFSNTATANMTMADSSVKADVAKPSSHETVLSTTDTQARQRLIDFYTRYNPAKLDSVDKTLHTYRGRYDELFAKLEARYKYPAPQGVGPVCFLDVIRDDLDGKPESAREIVIQLFASVVPKTAENFRALCTGNVCVAGKRLTYRNSLLHRVVPGMCVQGGDFTVGNGTGGRSIYQPPQADMWGNFADETFLAHSEAGLLSMANKGKNTNGSQFFITTAAVSHLNGKHVVFGRVLKGLEHVLELEKTPADASQRPRQRIRIVDSGECKPDGSGKVRASRWDEAKGTSTATGVIGSSSVGFSPLSSSSSPNQNQTNPSTSIQNSSFGGGGATLQQTLPQNSKSATDGSKFAFGVSNKQTGSSLDSSSCKVLLSGGDQSATNAAASSQFQTPPPKPSVSTPAANALTPGSSGKKRTPQSTTFSSSKKKRYVFGGSALRQACREQISSSKKSKSETKIVDKKTRGRGQLEVPLILSISPDVTETEVPMMGFSEASKDESLGDFTYFQARYAQWKSSPRKRVQPLMSESLDAVQQNPIDPMPVKAKPKSDSIQSTPIKAIVGPTLIKEESEKEFAQSLATKSVADTSESSEKVIRERLIAFFEKYSPSKLPYVEKTLMNYRGRYTEMFQELQKRYPYPIPAGTGPVCFLEFSKGRRIQIQLFESMVPKTAGFFRSLCIGKLSTNEKRLSYRNGRIHKIEHGVGLYGGVMTTGTGNDVTLQVSKGETMTSHHEPGLLSLVQDTSIASQSQFIITTAACPQLDGKSIIFGRVSEGMDLIYEMETRPINIKQRPVQDIVIVNCGKYETDGSELSASHREMANDPRSQPKPLDKATLVNPVNSLPGTFSGSPHASTAFLSTSKCLNLGQTEESTTAVKAEGSAEKTNEKDKSIPTQVDFKTKLSDKAAEKLTVDDGNVCGEKILAKSEETATTHPKSSCIGTENGSILEAQSFGVVSESEKKVFEPLQPKPQASTIERNQRQDNGPKNEECKSQEIETKQKIVDSDMHSAGQLSKSANSHTEEKAQILVASSAVDSITKMPTVCQTTASKKDQLRNADTPKSRAQYASSLCGGSKIPSFSPPSPKATQSSTVESKSHTKGSEVELFKQVSISSGNSTNGVQKSSIVEGQKSEMSSECNSSQRIDPPKTKRAPVPDSRIPNYSPATFGSREAQAATVGTPTKIPSYSQRKSPSKGLEHQEKGAAQSGTQAIKANTDNKSNGETPKQKTKPQQQIPVVFGSTPKFVFGQVAALDSQSANQSTSSIFGKNTNPFGEAKSPLEAGSPGSNPFAGGPKFVFGSSTKKEAPLTSSSPGPGKDLFAAKESRTTDASDDDDSEVDHDYIESKAVAIAPMAYSFVDTEETHTVPELIQYFEKPAGKMSFLPPPSKKLGSTPVKSGPSTSAPQTPIFSASRNPFGEAKSPLTGPHPNYNPFSAGPKFVFGSATKSSIDMKQGTNPSTGIGSQEAPPDGSLAVDLKTSLQHDPSFIPLLAATAGSSKEERTTHSILPPSTAKKVLGIQLKSSTSHSRPQTEFSPSQENDSRKALSIRSCAYFLYRDPLVVSLCTELANTGHGLMDESEFDVLACSSMDGSERWTRQN